MKVNLVDDSRQNEELLSIVDNISEVVDGNMDKQEIFDRFLTYRRRMARLGAIQALYLYDFNNKQKNNEMNIFGALNLLGSKELCQEITSFYKNVFFTKQDYGLTKKNRKIDETFMFDIVNKAVNSIQEIDDFIQSRLSGNWTTEKLDYVLRAIIRCAVAEILLGENIEKAVLCSEYTNLAGNFFNTKEIGFINGIVDKLYTTVTKIYPFANTKSTNKQ